MTIPNLKRIKIGTVQQFENWLQSASADLDHVMITTTAAPTSTTHVSGADIAEICTAHGWHEDRSYTLNGGLMGHVIKR